jgi:hypothetical protein
MLPTDEEVEERIENIRGVGSMTEKFKTVICYFSEPGPISQIGDQWSPYAIALQGNYIMDNGRKIPYRCICSHLITKHIYIRNKINSNILRVGTECIEKLNSPNLTLQIKGIIKLYWSGKNGLYQKCLCCNFYRSKVRFGVCPLCTEEGKFIPDWKEKITNQGRKCSICLTLIPENAEEWKKECTDCYLARKKCSTCSKVMPSGSEEWKKDCYSCWKNKKN